MKKSKFAVGVIVLILTLLTTAGAVNSAEVPRSMEDYLAAIDRVNEDYGGIVYIPAGTEAQVYANIKDRSPEEFEAGLRASLDELALSEASDAPDADVRIWTDDVEVEGTPLPQITAERENHAISARYAG